MALGRKSASHEPPETPLPVIALTRAAIMSAKKKNRPAAAKPVATPAAADPVVPVAAHWEKPRRPRWPTIRDAVSFPTS